METTKTTARVKRTRIGQSKGEGKFVKSVSIRAGKGPVTGRDGYMLNAFGVWGGF